MTTEATAGFSAADQVDDGVVTLPEAQIRLRPDEPTRLYELRVLDGCPKQTFNVSAAGATFSRFAGNPSLGMDGALVGRLEFPRARLTDREVEIIKAKVARFVVLHGAGGTGNVYEVGHAALRGQKRLEPLARYLSLRVIPEAAAGPEPEPVSMAGVKE